MMVFFIFIFYYIRYIKMLGFLRTKSKKDMRNKLQSNLSL